MKFEHCRKCVIKAGQTDFFIALAQAIFRSLLGWISGSMGLVVQGLYSFGDALGKGITLISVQIAKRPPTKTFPFGYGKILFVSSLAISLWLLFGGISLGLTSFNDIESVQSIPSIITVCGVILSAFASELTYLFLTCVAKENSNGTIESSAMDNRVDAFSSVIVLFGIVLSNLGVPAADHIAAFVVSLMVIRIGGIIAWDAIKGLLDVTVSQENLDRIVRISRTTSGVHDVKLVRGRSLGEYWEIYLHIALDENISIGEGYGITKNIKKRIQEGVEKVQHVWIVIVPQEPEKDKESDYWKGHLFSIPRSKVTTNSSADESVVVLDNPQNIANNNL
ncbi:putative Cation efflux protein [Gammaproteobacteria bacterium]